jgi:hypothetical protein
MLKHAEPRHHGSLGDVSNFARPNRACLVELYILEFFVLACTHDAPPASEQP